MKNLLAAIARPEQRTEQEEIRAKPKRCLLARFSEPAQTNRPRTNPGPKWARAYGADFLTAYTPGRNAY